MALIISMSVMGGCSQQMKDSAGEVVANAIEAEREVNSYYAEATMKTFEKEQLVEDAKLIEYMGDNGKMKMITENKKGKERVTVLNDGKQMLMYDEGNKQAFSMNISSPVDMLSNSPKESVNVMLESMKDTHKQQVIGEEKINGFNTTHIKLKPNRKDDIIGETDLWIDQKTWFIIKSKYYTADTKMIIEYKKVDFSPKFADDTFKLDIPKSVKITPTEDMNNERAGTIEDAEAAIGQPFLLINENDATVEKIMLADLNGEIDRTEVNVSYKNENGPLFNLAVFKTPEDDELKVKGNYKIRGQNAEYYESIRNILWDENGVRYTIYIQNPHLPFEDVVKMMEKMKLSSDK
ncbi:outer membrane lipoprotein-sorting protein [Bacillus sp. JJ722]